LLKECRLRYALCLLICYCLVFNVLIVIPDLYGPEATVLKHGLDSHGEFDTVSVDMSVTAGLFEMNLTASLLRIDNPRNISRIAVYYDADYPMYAELARILGFRVHLESELKNRGLSYEVSIINASQFVDVLLRNETDCILVVATSVLPAVVFSRIVNRITPWLQAGGRMIWMGFSFGDLYSYGNQLGIISTFGVGQRTIMGYDLNLSFGEFNWTRRSNLMDSLGLQWMGSRFGPGLRSLRDNNATILGTIDEEHRTSIAFCPVGKGGVLIFGDYVSTLYGHYPEAIIAADVAQILFSCSLTSIRYYTSQNCIVQKRGSVSLSLELTYLKSDGFSQLIVFTVDRYYHRFYVSYHY
jgi:hypothetical protein